MVFVNIPQRCRLARVCKLWNVAVNYEPFWTQQLQKIAIVPVEPKKRRTKKTKEVVVDREPETDSRNSKSKFLHLIKDGNICASCTSNAKYRSPFFKVYLCNECSTSNYLYKVITKSDALKQFKLVERDLEDVNCVLKQNPHYRSSAPMRLYSREEIITVAIEKHGSLEEMESKKKDLEIKKRKRQEDNTKLTKKREVELKKRLKEAGLEFRNDSWMCKNYILKGKPDIDEVVATMKKMHILYNKMDFETKWQKHKKYLFDGCYVSKPEFDEAKREYEDTIYRKYLDQKESKHKQ
eukprot:TRINITY_DN15704_c0_g1_i1.p1 TRINITY_DN15704_c0_g1~~TRINITY_DN15704_c0_g1_i1.p1  ORF type:complete len:295 (-),score=44.42 TRINITY_DN15704_c0_g1_i1:161-1045(-)